MQKIAGLLVGMCLSTAVQAQTLIIKVSLSEQRVSIQEYDAFSKEWSEISLWKVSTGRVGHSTPPGVFIPESLDRYHKSSLYDDAPMPFSIFFNGNIAVHGTDAEWALGKRASHGCVRLSVTNAEKLFNLLLKHKKINTRVIVE